MSDRTRSRLSIVAFALLGVAFGAAFFGAGLWARSSTQPLAGGVIVLAEVVDISVGSNNDGDTMYTPVVSYIDPATGETHRLTGSVSSSSRPSLGSVEEVSIVPGDPETARVVGPAWFPWIFILVGGLVMLGSVLGAAKALSLPLTDPADQPGMSHDFASGELGTTVNLGRTDNNHMWTMTDEPLSTDT